MRNQFLPVLFISIIVGCSSTGQNATQTVDARGQAQTPVADALVPVDALFKVNNQSADAANVTLPDAGVSADIVTSRMNDAGQDTLVVKAIGSDAVDMKLGLVAPDVFSPDVMLFLPDVAPDKTPLIGLPDLAPPADVAPDNGPDIFFGNDPIATPADLAPDIVIIPDVLVVNDVAAPPADVVRRDTVKRDTPPPPVCMGTSDYALCGTDNSGCCSVKYQTKEELPSGTVLVKTADSPQIYYLFSGKLVKIAARVALPWTARTNCNDPCIYANPPVANGCVGVVQIDAPTFASFTLVDGVEVPPRPGTAILVYNGTKYVSSGQAESRMLHELQPPELGSQIIPGGLEYAINDTVFNEYTIGDPITDPSQYRTSQVCGMALILTEVSELVTR